MNSKEALLSPGRLWRKNEKKSISHKEPETSSMYFKAGLGFLQKSVTLKWLWAQKDRCAGFPSQGTGLYHLLQGQRDSSQTIYFPPKDE